MTEFSGGDINAVLKLVKSLVDPDDGDAQLSILTMALVIGCRSCGVSKEDAMLIISDTFDQELKLIPFDQLDASRS
jgi:hypothetical protein